MYPFDPSVYTAHKSGLTGSVILSVADIKWKAIVAWLPATSKLRTPGLQKTKYKTNP